MVFSNAYLHTYTPEIAPGFSLSNTDSAPLLAHENYAFVGTLITRWFHDMDSSCP